MDSVRQKLKLVTQGWQAQSQIACLRLCSVRNQKVLSHEFNPILYAQHITGAKVKIFGHPKVKVSRHGL